MGESVGYKKAVQIAACAIIENADLDQGAEGLGESYRMFVKDVKLQMAAFLLNTLKDIKGMSIEELRKLADG